jgi:hypothetical protein
MLQISRIGDGGSYHQFAIRHRLGHSVVLLRLCQEIGGSDRRPRLSKSPLIRIHHAQWRNTEIAHGSGRRAYVQRISGCNQHHPQISQIVYHSSPRASIYFFYCTILRLMQWRHCRAQTGFCSCDFLP